jgi:hypothetical protein
MATKHVPNTFKNFFSAVERSSLYIIVTTIIYFAWTFELVKRTAAGWSENTLVLKIVRGLAVIVVFFLNFILIFISVILIIFGAIAVVIYIPIAFISQIVKMFR